MLRVDTGGLVTAGSRVSSAASALRDVDATTPFTTAGQALPGSQVSQACVWVGTRLGAALQVYADGLDSLATAATLTARDLDGTDVAVASRMHAGTPR